MTSTTPPDSDVRSFADFGVTSEIVEALADAGITSPFPIQELTLPLALSGADLIGQARTGTGKTLAFGIPLLQRVDAGVKATQALVIVPTRELCLQVCGDLEEAGARLGVEVVAAYGGKAIDPQIDAIAGGAQIVVGTPGRLLDLVGRGVLKLGTATSLVLDEADEMLDLGFLPDVERLIEATASGRQTLLFSATMPSAVVALARRYMHKPTFLRAEVEETRIAPETRQFFFSCHRMDKPAVLARILQAPGRGLCVVFTRTKRMADVLAEELRTRGISAAPIHSDLRQEARERALAKFRKGTIDVLVATEVAARGLDITDVTHVVNYDCPDDEKMYLHRIGRTGRAGAAGVAITFAVWNELARMEMIKKALEVTEPTHEVFSTSPLLAELFDLPADPGRRPAAAVEEVEERTATKEKPSGGAEQRKGDRGGSRSRGGRGRGRGRRGDAAAAGGADATDAVATAAPEADGPTAEVDGGTGDEVVRAKATGEVSRRVRTRRRTTRADAQADDVAGDVADRRREEGDPDVEPHRAPALADRADGDGADGGGADDDRADGGTPERRVRTRTRSRSGADRVADRGAGVEDDTQDSDDAERDETGEDRPVRRTRTRSRGRGGAGRSAAEGADVDASDDETSGQGDGAKRSSGRGSSGGSSSGRSSSGRSSSGRSSSGRGSSGRGSSGRGSSERGSSGGDSGRASSGRGSSGRGSSGRGSSGRGSSDAEASTQESSGRGGSGRGSSGRGGSGRGSSGRGGSGRSSSSRSRSPRAPQHAPVDTDAARDGGKPTLQRRMTIQHLP